MSKAHLFPPLKSQLEINRESSLTYRVLGRLKRYPLFLVVLNWIWTPKN
jgi:hypothetical protein